jgi:hypothetical protein
MRKRHRRDTRFVERLASENTPAQGLRSEVAPQKIPAGGAILKKRIYPFLRHAVEQTGPVSAFLG